jgi:hypothetical protein
MTEPAPDLLRDAGLDPAVAEAVRRIAIAGFHALWRGRTPTLAELDPTESAASRAAADHLRAQGRIEVSADGRVVAIHGLARRPTRHRIEHDGGVVHTWCALDAVGIPAALAIDARAVTECPTCARALSVTLIGGEPRPLSGVLLWYPEGRWGHLVDDFCSGANLFCSADHLQRWRADHSGAGRNMTIDEVAEVGRTAWREVAVQ